MARPNISQTGTLRQKITDFVEILNQHDDK
jgi:hypothetical protein